MQLGGFEKAKANLRENVEVRKFQSFDSSTWGVFITNTILNDDTISSSPEAKQSRYALFEPQFPFIHIP